MAPASAKPKRLVLQFIRQYRSSKEFTKNPRLISISSGMRVASPGPGEEAAVGPPGPHGPETGPPDTL
ncbi:hypothetical protein RRG08_032782 [Elysia crispata]|uniref:Uncharacterized protein n=1 Tax=Elysia crispata TaxID=231223 RepID=A0AAE0YPQ0_9GAST|nr:hypothetical protein RRG08_032782 [Elysia crispata]